MSRRRRKNPVDIDANTILVLGAIGVGAYFLHKLVCGITLPSWMGGEGESLLCTGPGGTPSALNTPATGFDASGNVVPLTDPEATLTDPYTTFGP